MKLTRLSMLALPLALLACGSTAETGGTGGADPDVTPGEAGVLDFQLELAGDPVVGALEGEVVLTKAGVPITGADVRVGATMPAHSHTAEAVRAEDAGDGRYHFTGVDLGMVGTWDVRVDAESEEGDDTVHFEIYVE